MPDIHLKHNPEVVCVPALGAAGALLGVAKKNDEWKGMEKSLPFQIDMRTEESRLHLTDEWSWPRKIDERNVSI